MGKLPKLLHVKKEDELFKARLKYPTSVGHLVNLKNYRKTTLPNGSDGEKPQ